LLRAADAGGERREDFDRVLLLTGWAASGTKACVMSQTRPNILLFFTDQHRLSGLGCYGPTPCQTPNIDQLAREGVRFETASTCCPLCSPARASIMTGLHVHAHGLLSNAFEYGACVGQLPESERLLTRRLLEAGYRCGYVGKWHLGSERSEWFGIPQDPATPASRGFETIEYSHQAHLDRYGLTHDPKQTTELCRCERYDGPLEASLSHWLADQTMMNIDRLADDGKPFFMMHSDPGPHAGYIAPQQLYDLYRDVEIPEWPNYRWDAQGTPGPHQVKIHRHASRYTWKDWAEVLRHYYARCTLIDMQVGRIRDYLKKKGLLENTLILFTSDHGETLGSHGGLIDKGFHHFEEIQRIGMVAAGPVIRNPGRTIEQWASLLDLYPTILDMAGARFEPESAHGMSLLPLLRDEPTAWRDELFVEFFGLGNLPGLLLTCRHGNLKYGWNPAHRDELYDLEADPNEMHNRIDDPGYAPALAEMRRRTLSFMERTGHRSANAFKAGRLA
jgi:arylsulfatase A-like enzyme